MSEPTWEERMELAEEAGFEAGRHGLPRSANPHAPGTPAHERWLDGWRAAHEKAGSQ
jgi:ribosome modulation factor